MKQKKPQPKITGGNVETLVITNKDIKDNKYIAGAVNFKGNVEIAADLGWLSFASLKVTNSIVTGAGTGIKADEGIEAGGGIEAGVNISAGLRIFAGLIMWRKPKLEELEIKCQQLESGEVACGNLIETNRS